MTRTPQAAAESWGTANGVLSEIERLVPALKATLAH